MNKFCFDQKIKVAMRGTGGAAYGQTQLDQGIIIDSSSMKSMKWVNDELVQLDPGLIWAEVLDFTIQKKRSPPVMPDTIVTSVGGKANVGGIGETSYNFGSITDQIVEFDLVTIQGDLLTCNKNQNSELFSAALGSMGQFGFMVRIVMKTILAPDLVYSWQFKYDGHDYSFLGDMKVIVAEEKNGALAGHFVRNQDGKNFTYVMDVTAWTSSTPNWLSKLKAKPVASARSWSFYEYANRNTKGWNDAVNSGATKLPHPYMSFFLPFDRSQEMAEFLQSTELANLTAGRMMLMPILKDKIQESSFMLPQSQLIGHFRVYRIIRNGENGLDHKKVLAYNEEQIVPKILQLGGKVYLPFSPLLTNDQLKEQFVTKHYEQMKSLKVKMDPQNLLNADAGVFRS